MRFFEKIDGYVDFRFLFFFPQEFEITDREIYGYKLLSNTTVTDSTCVSTYRIENLRGGRGEEKKEYGNFPIYRNYK